MSKERWRTVPEYPDYKVSDHGIVMRGKRLLTNSKNHSGYSYVCLFNGGSKKNFMVSRLVLTCFIRKPNKGEHAAHLNGDVYDNRLENLKWCTPKENAAHKKQHGTYLHGSTAVHAKFSKTEVQKIRKEYREPYYIKSNIAELARKYKTSKTTIESIVKRKTYKCENPK